MAPLTVHSHLFPREGVQLGRLVTTVKSPQSSYYPPGKQTFLKGDIHPVVSNDFHSLREHSKGTKLEAVLTKVASLLFHNTNELETKITNTRCITYYLDNADGKFASMCKVKEARMWFEDAYKKRKHIYMVTAIQTITDATMELSGTSTGEGKASGTLPVSVIAGTIAPTDLCDPKFSAERRTEMHRETGFVAEGEQIYAIQYRKINFRLFSTHNMNEAYLEEGNRWKVMWKTMGAKEGNDVLEVRLADIHEPVENMSGVSASTIDGVSLYYISDLP